MTIHIETAKPVTIYDLPKRLLSGLDQSLTIGDTEYTIAAVHKNNRRTITLVCGTGPNGRKNYIAYPAIDDLAKFDAASRKTSLRDSVGFLFPGCIAAAEVLCARYGARTVNYLQGSVNSRKLNLQDTFFTIDDQRRYGGAQVRLLSLVFEDLKQDSAASRITFREAEDKDPDTRRRQHNLIRALGFQGGVGKEPDESVWHLVTK